MRLLDLKIGDVVPHRPAYRAAPIPEYAPLQWFVAIVSPGREQTTRDRLIDLGLGLKPLVPIEHKHVPAGRRRKREVALPIFKSYVFIPMPDIREIWHEVLATPGVQEFLSNTAYLPKMLAPAEIERIRVQARELDAKWLQRSAAAGQYPVEIGARVWVKDLLPFHPLLGNVRGYDKRGRAEVELLEEVLGRKHFAIEPHRLQAIDV